MPSMPDELICIHTTTDSRDSALRIARQLIEQRLAACVQLSEIESVYRWQDRIETAPEQRLLIKTLRAQYQAVEQLILSLHPYELPAIWAVPVSDASPAYAQWVARESATGAS